MKILIGGDFVSQRPKTIIVGNELRQLILAQDFVAINFEAPLKGAGFPIAKSGPTLTQSIEAPKFLVDLGVNVVLLANNHMMDMGKDGCENTISKFKELGITAICGAGKYDEAYNICLLKKRGLTIGLLNLTHMEFGTLDKDCNKDSYGTAWIGDHNVDKIIIDAKKHCDYLLVIPHTGIEDLIAPLPEWRQRYRDFVNLGADAVIASHPHTPQGWEEYNGCPIFYSLGNFFFQTFSTSHGANWFKGLLVALNINIDCIKYKVYNTKFTENSIDIDDDKNLIEFNIQLNSLISDNHKYNSYINTELMKLWSEYKLYLLRGLAAVTPTSNMHVLSHAAYGLFKGADYQMLLNNFQCESHRWAIERMIKLQISN